LHASKNLRINTIDDPWSRGEIEAERYSGRRKSIQDQAEMEECPTKPDGKAALSGGGQVELAYPTSSMEITCPAAEG
jgi:hypothetical protein